MSMLPSSFLKPIAKHYRIEQLIGSGSFSDVFRAIDNVSKETVALKCFKQQMKWMGHFRSAAKEIAFLRLLDHPNIIQLKSYDLNKEFVFIGTEYAMFGSLRNYLSDKVPCKEDVIQIVMRQLLSALDYMHILGILHGDIKTHNILVHRIEDNNKPAIKIADFGLSELKLVDCNLMYQAGSLNFMAPEVLLKMPVDTRCDLWSAGVVMYYMMFGKTLYGHTEKDKERHIDFIRRKMIPDFRDQQRYSASCNHLVRGLLQFDKEERFCGVFIRRHPFVELKNCPYYGLKFMEDGSNHATEAVKYAAKGRYGESLVLGIQGILELKIQANLTEDPKLREYLFLKWTSFENFVLCQEKLLILSTACKLDPKSDVITHEEFRKHLISTPRILVGFDIGCDASMYLREGHKDRAINMFHQALQILLPLMKTEPDSNRKEILGRKIKRWIGKLEQVTVGASARESDTMTSLMLRFGIRRNLKYGSNDEGYLADVSIIDSQEEAAALPEPKKK
ncbi:serine/threonine-protein kinase ULK3-like isoform X2 [Anthonomus grandis grandis]|uniref:serine/threonine-protein kinase ULK3-like isoform X2 n=1 Tax=Anthonomus grandis grandis TaxID=2921223 RepID=UPI0021668D7D|nr:serine/threonine-protein kinase ULK3-like isoform X2 [Anthonomus grandis grandis]